jgi:hypothetical protein
MTEDGPEATPGGADGPEGVFGNLPSTRPGSRSPRRRDTQNGDKASEKAPDAPEPAAAKAKPAPKSNPPTGKPKQADPAAPEREPGPPDPLEDPLAPQPSIQGVEDLAWAGVAVVAQAATAGIRFTSKALEAARKSVDRP